MAGGFQLWCRSRNLSAGDRLAVRLPPHPYWIPLLSACWRESIILVPLHTRQPASVLDHHVREVGAMAVLHEFPQIEPETVSTPYVDLSRPATLVFTSGSSGSAKTRVHSFGNHLVSAQGCRSRDQLQQGDSWLLSLPLYHMGGLAILFRCLLAGASVVFPEDNTPAEQLLCRGTCSHASLVPTQLHRLLDLSAVKPEGLPVKRVLIGGAAVEAGLLSRAYAGGWPVAASYGSTETASQVVSVPPGISPESARGSSGTCLPHADLKTSASGELLVRSESLCLGTWKEGSVIPLTDPGGWYHTGDIARTDQGWVHIDGRLDHMFISGGENVHPEQIENVLQGVCGREQVVVVAVPDAEFGHRPGAWVTGPLSQDDVGKWREELRNLLPGYMVPVGFRSLPEGNGLKPDRKALADAWR